MNTWGSLFNSRQVLAMVTLVEVLQECIKILTDHYPLEYAQSIATYLGLWASRNAMRFTNMGRYDSGGETFQSPFSLQAIPMVWDYSEPNPFNEVTGGLLSQLDWILRVINHESSKYNDDQPARVICGDGSNLPIPDSFVSVAVTDPPYFDSIAYADLSDFFYIWLKRGLSSSFPEIFSTPLTPKGEEATALRYCHGDNIDKAKLHFTNKLTGCLAEAKRVCKPDGIVAVMFAHQSTEAWTALVTALFEADLNITATYPIDTELKNRSLALSTSALESSITVICRPREVGNAISFRDVRHEIEKVVAESVHRFWGYGFRGADFNRGLLRSRSRRVRSLCAVEARRW